ncbi:MAG: class I SAM-dependent methyltransferase [Oscillospiraceae bacterium]|nr:class I SAM-dependent methyltransferase [Oscillospiraceae bacterium]MDD4368221.1 class I SAM-dependent methyltransferase [Oscillospiraceae bacterium]
MSRQNIYDDRDFFLQYLELRQNPYSANAVEENPALLALLGEVKNQRVLDLGCGYGEMCQTIAGLGAAQVQGIDLSEKMIHLACQQNKWPQVSFSCMAMEDIGQLDGQYDLIISSLALHYIEDYEALMRQVFYRLKPGGRFVFSQEHPLTTAPLKGPEWIRTADGQVDHHRLTDYMHSGARRVDWLVDGVIKYHRTFSDLINGLTAAGLQLDQLQEPLPSADLLQQKPQYAKTWHKPDFLLIRALKPGQEQEQA